MMSAATSLINVVIAIVGGLFLLAVGVLWSRGAWSKGMFGFDLGYLIVAVAVFRLLFAKIRGNVLRRNDFLRLLLPLIPAWLLEGLALYSLSNLKHSPTLSNF